MASGMKKKYFPRNIFFSLLIIANGLTVLFGVIYVLTNASQGLWNVYGALLLLTLVGNIIATLWRSPWRSLDYTYLLFISIALIAVPLLNRAAAADVANVASRSNISILLLFFLFVFGGVLAGLKRRGFSLSTAGNSFNKKVQSRSRRKFKLVLTVFLTLVLLIGVYLGLHLLIGRSRSFVELFLPPYALFFSMLFLVITVLILNIYAHLKTSVFNVVVATIGLITALMLSIPLLSTPFIVQSAEAKYQEAFQEEAGQIIPSEQQQYVSNTPFLFPDYFFGINSGEYQLVEDVLYYEGENGVDQGIKLHFDAYLPPAGQEDLPGDRSVLIRIHGGGWTTGDKGSMNNAQMNKYFASQGYVVFDVQYGLSNEKKLIEYTKVPENIVGGFTIDDMVRHIGLFTDYLAEHNSDYGANLDSVFISGGSAGGQLTNAVGLGLASKDFDEFNTNLNVKGIIPLYPANGLGDIVEIEGKKELLDPDFLVTEDSPPALIFQGTHDGIVPRSVAAAFDQAYKEKDNTNSALLMMPFAGHSSNSYFPGYYSQVFVYYMERFMYQFK
ncbi:alpha/beta hydrolase [Salsuginibacillus kocurii]|uniref:alpha/beta hydrolase n=1 Tax=Salsuginibacillus kocurii TaxID=427078 RepID=UPI0003739FF9|nr:alpha/beta hydrolase [Salsuginibacillus kocurii]